MNSDLKIIKKYYGEKMMHLCRSLFSTLLEQEGYLSKLLLDNFAPTKFLYEDIINSNYEERFKNYIYSIAEMDEFKNIKINKTPHELFNEIGYDLYECHTEEDIQKFKKYYASGEELCTFKGNRLDRCHVFFAVKKNVDEIKRENFKTPERQDEYGTSVISIQFSKGETNTLSIKNRYNHTVENPDATFSNNLENIIPGLTVSFEKEYNLNINQNDKGNFELPNYVKANDGRFYKYNYEINNKYYCPDNIIIDNFNVIDKYQEKEKYIIMDYFIVDLMEKKIYLYDDFIYDGFEWSLFNIKNIHISKDKNTKNRTLLITFDNDTNAIIEIDKCNRMISYVNENITRINDNFLFENKYLSNIDIPNVLEIGSNFLCKNVSLTNINLSKVLRVGDYFLRDNKRITSINVLSLMSVGDNFLMSNLGIEKLNMPNLEYVGDSFLEHNRNLREINALKLISVSSKFLYYNLGLKSINFPCLEYCEDHFITANNDIENIVNNANDKKIRSFLYSALMNDSSLLNRFRVEFSDFFPKLSKEEYKRKIYKGVSANVDFYSGFVYRMLDLPLELYTPIFAIARISGWSAHRIEELINVGKIIRPAYKNVAKHIDYQTLNDR